MEKQQRRALNSIVLSITTLVVVATLLLVGIGLVRDKMMRNTQQMGMSLAESYARETQSRLDGFARVFDMAWMYTIRDVDANMSEERMQEGMAEYQQNVHELFGGHVADLYAVIGGQIVAANPWTGDGVYDYSDTDWYQRALASPDEVIFSDVYEEAITGDQIFTLSKAIDTEGDVLVMDVYINQGDVLDLEISLPSTYHFYLFDTDGRLLYRLIDRQATDPAYAEQLISGVRDGSLFAYDAQIVDPKGVARGVYYAEMDNGWTVVMTIPIQEVLMGEKDPVIYSLIGVALIAFVTLLFMVVRDILNLRRLAETEKTIRVLSDSFFAIYRVDFEAGTYRAIKTSPDLRGTFAESGDYDMLLAQVKKRVHPEAYAEFEQDFSLKSIAQRVKENVLDYGGDYQRMFGGSYHWVNVRTIYQKHILPGEVILCFKDVDVEKRQQMQHMMILQEALDTAKTSAEARNTFFNTMSHDMRTPLNAVIGYSELIRRTPGDAEKVTGYIKKVEFAAKQLLMLINDILEMAKLEAGKSALDVKEFNLNEYLTEVCEMFRAQAERQQKHFELSVQIKDPVVKGDSFKIGQIMNNLLSNALKYSCEGAEIKVEARQFDYQKHSKFQIVVADTGIGMSEEFLNHIFEPYARETHFTPRTTEGTGLGMPIVKSLVQQMSGEITVESAVGKGSRFTVTLPLEVVEQHDGPVIGAAAGEASGEAAAEAAGSLAGQTILVAEDNELNMEIVTELLTMSGVQVIGAANGAEAVEKFQRSAPYSVDAILMDMQMPVLDGCGAARAIRRLDRPDAAVVPIVAVTANAFAEDVDRTTAAGMNAHVSKPIDMDRLLEALALCWAGKTPPAPAPGE
ncbi:hybrid sensor histidine kinase/response regulator [Allofournierella sp. CML151]|uniref:hybrid sensor histidine kinase/response regulator n=1 Tax=Allofournierella sp. CML151 TaxID=2998082 RepID=UPI0022EA3A87|nr:hybrid sensor histidine kinase/response regulator [Fournierella sp. CML151]